MLDKWEVVAAIAVAVLIAFALGAMIPAPVDALALSPRVFLIRRAEVPSVDPATFQTRPAYIVEYALDGMVAPPAVFETREAEAEFMRYLSGVARSGKK